MAIDGKWWVLVEEEALDMRVTSVYALAGGEVFDGRTGDRLGTYLVSANDGAVLTLDKGLFGPTAIRLRGAAHAPFDAGADRFEATIGSGEEALYGTAYRDGPHIQAWHDVNAEEARSRPE